MCLLGFTVILSDLQTHSDKMDVATQPDIMMGDKQEKTTQVINVPIPSNSNIRKKEFKKVRNAKEEKKVSGKGVWSNGNSGASGDQNALSCDPPKLGK